MKKIIIMVLIVITIFILVTTSINSNKLALTNEEKAFIKANKDTVFMVGYYPTMAEKRFSKKICEKIEADTSLKLRLYDDSWNNSLLLLKSGSLPIVMNMIKTEKRSRYADFTDSLLPISCGIYSDKENPIATFQDIEGKVIGVEKEVALLETFKEIYPKLQYDLKVYDTFTKTRQAFLDNEIDGFLSSKSYDEKVKGLHFYMIDSITIGTNHIGVNKKYPLLYSILSKEVEFLKEQKWDELVSNIINFELEKSLVNFTKDEEEYISEKGSLVVGLPSEYFLYVYGKEYNPKGIIARILEKIEFILDVNLVYKFDSQENLRLRNDIDFYLDNTTNNLFASTIIFNEDIVVMGYPCKKIINEMYDLSHYNIGILGVPNAKEDLQSHMPLMNIKEYSNYDDISQDLKAGDIDYIILPEIFSSHFNKIKDITNKGVIYRDTSSFVSSDNKCIDILDKCLSIIDINRILNDQRLSMVKQRRPGTIVVILGLALLIIYVSVAMILTIRNKYYFNNDFDIYDIKHLGSKIKGRDVNLILIEISNGYSINFYYGNKIYSKYVKKILESINGQLSRKEYIFYINKNRFIILKENDTDILSNSLINHDDLIINRVTLAVELKVCYVEHFGDENIINSIDTMLLALDLIEGSNKVLHFDIEEQNLHKNKISRWVKMKNVITEGDIDTIYKDVVDVDNKIFGKYANIQINDFRHITLRNNCLNQGLEIRFDKRVINHIVKEAIGDHLIIDVFEETLISDNFINWVKQKLSEKPDMVIYFLGSLNCYENNIHLLEGVDNIRYIIKDFGRDLKKDIGVKYYDIEYLLLDEELEFDIDDNREILDFIVAFAKENSKKIITQNIQFLEADFFVREVSYESIDN